MRKRKVQESLPSLEEVKTLQTELNNELETNPVYSLEVDPMNKYSLSELQKRFIKYYVQFRSVPTCAELLKISMDEAKELFLDYATEQEIRRINKAMYQRQFATKMASLDDISGYLTSLLTDENVPLCYRLKTTEKLSVVRTLLDVIKLKQESIQNPQRLININIANELKQLSVTTIRQLIAQSTDSDEKRDIISKHSDLTPEEQAFLSTLSTNELLELLDKTNSEQGGN